jgi:multidrug resistance efflux pump
MKRNNISLFFVAAVVTATLAGCLVRDKDNQLTLSGTLEMTEHRTGARVPGRIVRTRFREGDSVEKGDVLATLDRYEQAEQEWRRVQTVYENGGTDLQTLERAELAVEDQQVHSPVDGVILVKVAEAGEVVGSGAAVYVVGDRSDLWVRVFVPEGKINRVKIGSPATLQFDGIVQEQKGEVSYIAPSAEFTPRNVQTPEERVLQSFAVKVRLTQPPANLRPGVSATVTLGLQPA